MMLRSIRILALAATAALALVAPVSLAQAAGGGGEGAKPVEPPPPDQTAVRIIGKDGKPVVEAQPTSEVERYCSAITDPARESRIAAQTRKLHEMEAEVTLKIDELETKRAEYQQWLKERQAFLDSTSDIMTDIYAKMKPDAAAQQLAAVERPLAAAVLSRLKSRAASAILSEMPAPVAAELGNLIVAKTGRTPDGAMANSGKG